MTKRWLNWITSKCAQSRSNCSLNVIWLEITRQLSLQRNWRSSQKSVAQGMVVVVVVVEWCQGSTYRLGALLHSPVLCTTLAKKFKLKLFYDQYKLFSWTVVEVTFSNDRWSFELCNLNCAHFSRSALSCGVRAKIFLRGADVCN